MKVEDLIGMLQCFPQEMDVKIPDPNDSEEYISVSNVRVVEISTDDQGFMIKPYNVVALECD